MKTIRTTLTKSGPALYIKALISGLIAGIITLILLMLIFSILLLASGSLPHDFISWFGVGTYSISVFICSLVTARIIKHNGLIIGLVCAVFLLIIQIITGLFLGESITYLTFIKLFIFSLMGALGGIKGVNKKERLHIK